jgi:PIN domain nuclease of toxin-antitoxin system
VASLASRGKLEIDFPTLEWLKQALAEEPFALEPLTPEVADAAASFSSITLPDPIDRFIVATAVVLGARLVTADDRMHKSGLVECIW